MRDPNPRGRGFRLIRSFSPADNVRRLKAHCARLAKSKALAAFARRVRLRKRLAAIKATKRAA
jgi:hypothetical protein